MNNVLSLVVILFILVSPAIGQKESDTMMKIVDAEEFIIQMKLHEDHILIDVRTWMEYKKGRIPGAILAETNNVLFSITDTIDFDRLLFLYCATNFRSKSSGKLLAERGFQNIYILEVGFNGWKAAGKEIDKSKPKRKVHHEKKSKSQSQ
jgi:rhodanese-related sulfurtransferase